MAYFRCGGADPSVLSLPTIGEASGSIARFNTDLTENLLSAVAEFNASQDLHGQSSPYPAGGGKNKFSIDFLTASGITILNGEASGSAFTFADKFGATKFIPNLSLGANTQYTISFDAYTDGASTSGTGLYIAFKYDDESTSDARCPNNTLSYTRFSVSNDTSKNLVGIYISYSSKSSNIWYLKNIQLEEGSPATAYAPYENICPIVGVDKVNITLFGKNLWDEEWESGTYSTADGRPSVSANAIRSKNIIAIKPSLTFAFFNSTANAQIRLYYYDKSGTFLSWEAKTAVNNVVTFTTPENAYFVNFAVGNSVTPVTTNNQNLSLNYPSTDTEYHAYTGGTTAIINLGGTYYGGKVDAVTGKITLTHVYVFSDGTDDTNWSYYSDFGSSYNFRYAYSGLKANGNIICNLLPKGNVGANREIVAISGNGNNINFEISSSRLNGNTVADLMTFFASNNVQIVAELATPIVVYASNTAEIPTIVGDNQVYADTGDVAVEYQETVGHHIN